MRENLDRRAAIFPARIVAWTSFACFALLMFFLIPQSVEALPIYARQTGLACGKCHVNPEGGGPRTAFGRAFAANGHRLPGTKSPGERYDHGSGYGPGMMGGHGGMMDGNNGMMGGQGGMGGGYDGR